MRITQRQVMCDIYARSGRDRDRAIEAYAAAERRGDVPRRRNGRGISPEQYAIRLFADGINKGWLK